MSKISKESISSFVEKKYGPEAAAGFGKWVEQNSGWNRKFKKYASDYKAFAAGGKSAKNLKKEDIYNYLREKEGESVTDAFMKYSNKESLKKLAKAGKGQMKGLGALARKGKEAAAKYMKLV